MNTHNPAERILEKHIIVECSIDEAFNAWTTEAGVTSFLAPKARIDLRPGGRYEILFDLEAPVGQQGSEGQTVMALQRPTMFSFTWNSPPQLALVRDQQTHVLLRFYPLEPAKTKLVFRQDGWGTGDQWDSAYDYFAQAWFRIVLPRFQKRFLSGPQQWE